MDGKGLGLGWDLCAGLLYEHRFAMLIIVSWIQLFSILLQLALTNRVSILLSSFEIGRDTETWLEIETTKNGLNSQFWLKFQNFIKFYKKKYVKYYIYDTQKDFYIR